MPIVTIDELDARHAGLSAYQVEETALLRRRAAERLAKIARLLATEAQGLDAEATALDGVAQRRYEKALHGRRSAAELALEPL